MFREITLLKLFMDLKTWARVIWWELGRILWLTCGTMLGRYIKLHLSLLSLATSSLLFCLLLPLVLLLKYMLPLPSVATYFATYLCCYCVVCFEVVVTWYYPLPIFANMGVWCYVLLNYCFKSPLSFASFTW